MENTMENFVNERIDQVLKRFPNCCHCSRCRQDILVLALNHLPPRYCSSNNGEVYTRLDLYDTQQEAEIFQEITKAVEIVSSHPRHAI